MSDPDLTPSGRHQTLSERLNQNGFCVTLDSLETGAEGHDQMTLFTKSVAIDPEDYKAYMRSCWWNGVHLLWTHLGFISDLRKLDIKFT